MDIVIPDVERAAIQQLDYLLGMGHQRIACFKYRPLLFDKTALWQDRRFWRAYDDYMVFKQIPLPHAYLEPIDFGSPPDTEATVKNYLDRILNSGHPPTAIVTHDNYACALIRQLTKLRIRVPEDISIVGYDDDFHGDHSPILLTTYRQNFDAMDPKAAIELLLKRIEDPHRVVSHVEIEGKLLVRDSCMGIHEAVGEDMRSSHILNTSTKV